jgi:hypothetical protein
MSETKASFRMLLYSIMLVITVLGSVRKAVADTEPPDTNQCIYTTVPGGLRECDDNNSNCPMYRTGINRGTFR